MRIPVYEISSLSTKSAWTTSRRSVFARKKGENNTAMGENNTAMGENNTAMGENNPVYGIASSHCNAIFTLYFE